MSETSVKIWLPWFPADYLRDTITFTLEEDAVYRRALDFLWQNPQGIPKETRRLCLALRIQADELERTLWVLDKFLALRDGFYFNDKLEEHRQKALRNRAIQRENGLKGGRPEKPKKTHGLAESNPKTKPNHNPNESPSPSPSPSPSNFTFKKMEEIFGKAKSQAEERKFFDAFQGFLKLEATNEEIKIRADRYKAACPSLAFTPHAVLHNWERFEKAKPNISTQILPPSHTRKLG